jgi:hypothetical protein
MEEWDFAIPDRLFRISTEDGTAPAYRMPAEGWQDRSQAEEALRMAGDWTAATGMELPASMAGLSLLNLCATVLLFQSRIDRWLDLRLEGLTFRMEQLNGHVRLGYRIDDLRWLEIPSHRRGEFLEERWTSYLQLQIRPAVEMIASAAGVKEGLVWNQYGGQLIGLREYLVREETGDVFRERFDTGVSLLAERLPSSVFGTKRNPFLHRPRYIDNPWQPGGSMVVRSSCCMYDRRQGGDKCYNCPRLTETERERRRQSILSQAGP